MASDDGQGPGTGSLARDLAALEAQLFDAVIVGGGVLGALTAWDAALRGLQIALVERDDFGAGSSTNSLRIVHGGLRYLTRFDLPRMRASMAERAAWMRIAPHLIDPLAVLAPLRPGPPGTSLAARAATALANVLSADRNHGLSGGRPVPPAGWLDPAGCAALHPALEGAVPSGGILFHDAIVHAPDRLLIAVLQGAAGAGARLANHVECTGPLLVEGTRIGIEARDRLGSASLAIRGRVIVNCSGAGAITLSERLAGGPLAGGSIPSLALNVVVPGDGARTALALPGSGRRILRVPWRGRTLIGTLHLAGEPDDLPRDPAHPAVTALLEEHNAHWPGAPLDPGEVLGVQAGLLPAEGTGAHPRTGEPRLTRRPRLRFVTTEGGSPVLEAETLNFTLARRVAEGAVDRICQVVRTRIPSSRTARTPLPAAGRADPATLRALAGEVLEPALGGGLPLEELARTHGMELFPIAARIRSRPDEGESAVPGLPVTRAQLRHAVDREMARTPGDVVERRLGIPGPFSDALHSAATETLALSSPDSRKWDNLSQDWDFLSSLDGGPPSLPSWLVDGHLHLHSLFDSARFVRALVRNLAQAAAARDEPIAGACLLLAQIPGEPGPADFFEKDHAGGWSLAPTAEEGSHRLHTPDPERPLLLVEGAQLVTAEKIEVLALCTPFSATPRPGRPLPETLDAVRKAGGFPVIPWGFGKWTGTRGRRVREALEEAGRTGAPLALGDNRNRPAGAPRPRLLLEAESAGIPILPGSDPFPFAEHAERPGSAGFVLTGPLDPARPRASVRWTLATLSGSPPPFGSGTPPLAFIRDQLAMQRRKRTRP